MEIELKTSDTRRLDQFLTSKLPTVKLLAAYFLRQCANDDLEASTLYALDDEGGLVAVDVESLCHNTNDKALRDRLQDGYYELIEALQDYPELLREKFQVFLWGIHPEGGILPLKYYGLYDLGFEQMKGGQKVELERQMSMFSNGYKPEYRLVYKKKRMSQGMLKQRFLQPETAKEFGYVLTELKQAGMKLVVPENMAAVKAFHPKTGQEVALLYPADTCFGFELAGHGNRRRKIPAIYESYGHWLANCLRPLKTFLAQQELFSYAKDKIA